MIYFDLRESMAALSIEQRGHLLDFILAYGEAGTEPKINDPALAVAWAFVKPKIDADAERYAAKTQQARSAASSRYEKERPNADACGRIRTHAKAANSSTPQHQLNPPQPNKHAGFTPGGNTQPSMDRINRNADELDAFLQDQGVEL